MLNIDIHETFLSFYSKIVELMIYDVALQNALKL
jgi:hypothetical protein